MKSSALIFCLLAVSLHGEFEESILTSTEIRVLSLLPKDDLVIYSGDESVDIPLSDDQFSPLVDVDLPLVLEVVGSTTRIEWIPSEGTVGPWALIVHNSVSMDFPAVYAFRFSDVISKPNSLAIVNVSGIDLEGEVLDEFQKLKSTAQPLSIDAGKRFRCELHSVDHRYYCEYSVATDEEGWRWLLVISKPFIRNSGILVPKMIAIPPPREG